MSEEGREDPRSRPSGVNSSGPQPPGLQEDSDVTAAVVAMRGPWSIDVSRGSGREMRKTEEKGKK